MKSKRIKVEKNLKCATCYACASHATRMCHMRWWDASRIWGSQISTFCHKMRHNLRLAGSTCDSHVVSHMGQFDSFFFCKNQKLRLSISDFFFVFVFVGPQTPFHNFIWQLLDQMALWRVFFFMKIWRSSRTQEQFKIQLPSNQLQIGSNFGFKFSLM